MDEDSSSNEDPFQEFLQKDESTAYESDIQLSEDPFETYSKAHQELIDKDDGQSERIKHKRLKKAEPATPSTLPKIKIPKLKATESEENSSSESDTESSTTSENVSSPNNSPSSIPSLNLGDFEPLEFPDFDFMDTLQSGSLHSETKLFPESTLSTFQAVSILVTWHSRHPGISKSALDGLLKILHELILPKPNTLPTSYVDAKRMLQVHLSPVEEYDCCINDCIIFRDSNSTSGKYAALTHCPVCGEERYQTGTKISRKKFKFLPVEKRLRRIFANEITSSLMQKHSEVDKDVRIVSNIHESPAWREWYDKDGQFAGDQRAVTFAICMDGLNPFKKENVSYSMCPIFLIPLNFPDHVRKLSGSMFLLGIIPGPKEPEDTDPYLELVVEEIMQLNGKEFFDGLAKEKFKLKVNICLHIFDYPGQNKVLHCQGSGAYAGCAYCNHLGVYVKRLDKMVYLDHRRFLPKNDLLRSSYTNFPTGETCTLEPPEEKTQKYVDEANSKCLTLKQKQEIKEHLQETGCKGPYALRKLHNHDRLKNTPVEPMHTIKNISERIVKLLIGISDSVKVRDEECSRNRFTQPGAVAVVRERGIPVTKFRLTKSELKTANTRALAVCTPHGYDWTPQVIFKNNVHMKSIRWMYILSTGILKFCIRGCLGSFQRKTLFELCDVIALVVSDSINLDEIEALEYRVHRVLVLLERDFPVAIHVIMLHLFHHLPKFINRFGPVHGFWMYPMERLNSWIGQRVTNRRFPEATVLESYRFFELSFFLQVTNQLPSNATTDPSEVDFDKENEDSHPEQSCLPSNSKTQSLTAHQFQELENFYECTSTVPECAEKPANDVLTLRYIKKKDEHHRVVTYSCREQHLKHSSHVVSRKGKQNHVLGEIKLMFEHSFNGETRKLLQVAWFSSIEVDQESKLLMIDTESESTTTIVSTDDLGRPLVHAYEDNKLFVLNFN